MKKRNLLKLRKIFDIIMRDIIVKLGVASIIGGVSLFLMFGKTYTNNLVDDAIKKSCSSQIDIAYNADRSESILKDLQQRCGEKICYTSRIIIEKNKNGVPGYTAYIDKVIGWHPLFNKVVDLKQFADANFSYFQKHSFENASDVGLNLISASEGKCVSMSRGSILENGASYLDAVLRELKVDIGTLIACVSLDKKGDIRWATMLTVRSGQSTNCKNCMDDVRNANKQLEGLWK